MTTDEHFDGEVHGLLAGAFDGDLPAVNLVPRAVDGYRRHRRRTRVLGTAGGALAVAGVVAAGTALAGTGSRGTATDISAAHGGSGSRSGAGVTGGQPAADLKDPMCDGVFHNFSGQSGDALYTADTATLERVCASDLAHLRQAIPGARISPLSETYAHALAVHDVPPGTPPPAGRPEDTQWIQPGFYTVEAGGQKTYLRLAVTHKQEWAFNGCSPGDCPPNVTLADGTPATETSAAAAGNGIGMLSIHPDAAHWVAVSLSAPPTSKATLSFDFAKAVRTKAFAEAVAYDVRSLNRLD